MCFVYNCFSESKNKDWDFNNNIYSILKRNTFMLDQYKTSIDILFRCQ